MNRGKSRYVPALDGLRALAVLVVIAYHMSFDWAPGGLLGVTMFFVLSGYLITGLLIKEYDEAGTISLKNFWIRRIRRIIPAVVFAVVGTGFLCSLFNHALLAKMRPDVIPTLLFVNNWWQIIHDVSYFEALGQPSPLTHYWSLAIEEQYYLIWPVILLICMRFGVRKSTMMKGTLVLAIMSALEMALMFDPHADPSRVYYGTDTRAFSLLIGSGLAFVWPLNRISKATGRSWAPKVQLLFNGAGIGAVLLLILMVVVTNGFSAFIYRGGLVLCSLLTAVAIAVMVHPLSWLGKLFALPPFVWVGKMSYSMYLWHYPLILLMTPSNLVEGVPLWMRGLQLVFIFAASAFSYYVVENPIRQGAIGDFIRRIRAGDIRLDSWFRAHIVRVVAVALFFMVPLIGLAFVPTASTLSGQGALGNRTHFEEMRMELDQIRMNYEAQRGKPDPLLLGDSVPEGMYGYGVFTDVFPFGYIDAAIGRQFYDAPGLYAHYRDEGKVGNVVVIALGTNGYATREDADKLMAEVGSDQLIWFVNTRSPDEYVEESNATINYIVETYDNAHLIDWYSVSAGHPEYFDGDGTHLTPSAAEVYAHMIRDAVEDKLLKRDENDVKPVESSAHDTYE